MTAQDDSHPTATSKTRRRHPVFGCMKGTLKVAPDVDLTEPACPEWADIAEKSSIELAKMIDEGRAGKKPHG